MFTRRLDATLTYFTGPFRNSGCRIEDKGSMDRLNIRQFHKEIAMPYLGAKLYAMAVEKSWRLPHSWIGHSQHCCKTLPLRTDALTSAAVLKFRDDAFHQYFANHSYLAGVKSKFGEDVESHIQDMTHIRLRRKVLEEDIKRARAAAV